MVCLGVTVILNNLPLYNALDLWLCEWASERASRASLAWLRLVCVTSRSVPYIYTVAEGGGGIGAWRWSPRFIPTPFIEIRREGVYTGWTWLRIVSSDRSLRTQKCTFWVPQERECLKKITCVLHGVLNRTRWWHRKCFVVKIMLRLWLKSEILTLWRRNFL